MTGQSLTARLLESARGWMARLPEALAGQVVLDIPGRRLRLSHAKVEALVRHLLRDTPELVLRDWSSLPRTYDVRLTASGWHLRAEVVLERLELAAGGYRVWLRTPGRVELEERRAVSKVLQGALRVGAGRAALRAVLERLLPPGLRWDGHTFEIQGALPPEGPVPARLFESSPLSVSAEHTDEGLWLSADAWPGLVDLLQALFGADLPRTPPGSQRSQE